ncbi:O-antigen/teichoic acid export membrane protein [Balneicella halophila]|uniref:O-antigen/teichoic acid export membrane protein n=1 Tax=Balneicella halophila TaxID=1537566 RepID=A0A7L4UPD8_BALHA|nr:flippase [Balneicella halophila]PVX50747.1 O-antigen/teichoic acid export membrane protein [Balneicella halophila]
MIKNLGWIFLEKVGVVLFSFISSVLVARNFSVAEFGAYSFALSLLAVFNVFSHMGLPAVSVRELSVSKNKNYSLSLIFSLKIIGCVLGFVFFNLYAYMFIKEGVVRLMCFILSLSILFKVSEVIQYYFESLNENRINAQVKLTSSLIGSSSRILLALSSLRFYFVSFSYVLLNLSMFILFFSRFIPKVEIKKILKLPTFRDLVNLFKDCFLVFAGTIFAVLYLKIDQVMLESMINKEAVGIYAISSNLTEYWYFFPDALLVVLMPKLVKTFAVNKKNYYSYMRGITTFLFWSAFIVAICVNIFSRDLIEFIYGKKYIFSSEILNIHIWAALFIFMRVPFSKHIVILKMTKFSLITQGVGCIVNVLLNYFLIGSMGVKGAAVATFFSYFIAGFMLLVIFKETRSFFYVMLSSYNFRNLYYFKKIL